LPELQAALAENSIRPKFLFTTAQGHATELVANADLGEFDGLVAVGGDGTLFEVLNGLYEHPAVARIPLGLVPVGTGNAFARDLGLEPSVWRKAVDILGTGNTRSVDVGHVRTGGDEFRFLNIIGMGFAVDAGLTAKKLKFLGNAAYTMGTLWRVLQLKSYPLEIEIDGQRISQDNVFVEISNSRYTGTTFLIAPGASLDDGLLDVTLLRRLPRRRLLRLFPTIYSGRHVEFDEVGTYQASHIRIDSPAGMMLAPDGEFRGASPVEIRCLHKDLELFY